MSKAREGVRPSTRFRVFKRDRFTCTYCGRKPPDVELELDHIDPVSLGGDGSLGNLTTSCKTCNRGKAGEPLHVVPEALGAHAEQALEGAARLAKHVEAAEAQRLAEDAAIEFVFQPYLEHFRERMLVSEFEGVRRFLEHITVGELRGFMALACQRAGYKHHKAFRYFCKCCWNQIRSEAASGED